MPTELAWLLIVLIIIIIIIIIIINWCPGLFIDVCNTTYTHTRVRLNCMELYMTSTDAIQLKCIQLSSQLCVKIVSFPTTV